MPVKKTASLKVAASMHIAAGHISLHPNDGFDIGLMTKSHTVDWCTGIQAQEFIDGKTGHIIVARMDLLNECPQQTLQLNMGQWKHIGAPEQVVLLYDGRRMFLVPLKVSKKED